MNSVMKAETEKDKTYAYRTIVPKKIEEAKNLLGIMELDINGVLIIVTYALHYPD